MRVIDLLNRLKDLPPDDVLSAPVYFACEDCYHEGELFGVEIFKNKKGQVEWVMLSGDPKYHSEE